MKHLKYAQGGANTVLQMGVQLDSTGPTLCRGSGAGEQPGSSNRCAEGGRHGAGQGLCCGVGQQQQQRLRRSQRPQRWQVARGQTGNGL